MLRVLILLTSCFRSVLALSFLAWLTACNSTPQAPADPDLLAAVERVQREDPAMAVCKREVQHAAAEGKRFKHARATTFVEPVYLLGNSTQKTDTALVAVVLVDRHGKVNHLHVVSREDKVRHAPGKDVVRNIVRRDLEHAITQSVQKSTFAPARIDGKPVDSVLTIGYTFGPTSAAAFDLAAGPPRRSPSDSMPKPMNTDTIRALNQAYRAAHVRKTGS